MGQAVLAPPPGMKSQVVTYTGDDLTTSRIISLAFTPRIVVIVATAVNRWLIIIGDTTAHSLDANSLGSGLFNNFPGTSGSRAVIVANGVDVGNANFDISEGNTLDVAYRLIAFA